jgi:DNA-binding NarL/FixJ family response regulator
VLSTAAGLAVEHVPLMTAIRDLAPRPHRPDHHHRGGPDRRASGHRPFGLTDRELDVLRLLGQGKTNPEIAVAVLPPRADFERVGT